MTTQDFTTKFFDSWFKIFYGPQTLYVDAMDTQTQKAAQCQKSLNTRCENSSFGVMHASFIFQI
jgi:hypothetical protein